MNSNIAVTKWREDDEIATAIIAELNQLDYSAESFLFDSNMPSDIGFIFSFAPHGRLGTLIERLAAIPIEKRPVLIHWNFESLPNINIPWMILLPISKFRSWFDRCLIKPNSEKYPRFLLAPLDRINRKVSKFRYLGEYIYAQEIGVLQLLVDISNIYASFYGNHGVHAKYIPFGTSSQWYLDLEMERDIDVLWMGTRRTRRRSKLIDELRKQLQYYGIEMYIMDDVERPFIFGKKRIEFINRSKITLNLLPTWYDPAFIVRFHLVAGNRSLVVSEPILPHCPDHKAGEVYAEANTNDLAETIHFFINNDRERQKITDTAYNLVTKKLTLHNSIRQIMHSAESLKKTLYK
ncbi:MAG: glycosyltransferase family protein [Candidatus Kariarchaeaceae archaeon]|jgi:hypothetical protein